MMTKRSAWYGRCLPILLLAGGLLPLAHAQFVQQGAKLAGSSAIGQSSQGGAVATSADGNTAIVGGAGDNNGIGAVWVYTRSGSTWTQLAKLTPSDAVGTSGFGSSVAISADGNTAAIGGPNDGTNQAGATWVFARNTSSGLWSEQAKLLAPIESSSTCAACHNSFKPVTATDYQPIWQGSVVGLSANGNTLIVGSGSDHYRRGSSWIFTRSGSTWTAPASPLLASGPTDKAYQGTTVAVSGDGLTAITGGPSENSSLGAGWVYTYNGSAWTQQAQLNPPPSTGAYFGSSTALSYDGNTAILSQIQSAALGSQTNRNGAYVFTRSSGSWTQQGGKLVAVDVLGTSSTPPNVGLSSDGNTAIVGGPGDGGNYAAPGSAWIYRRYAGAWSQLGGKMIGTGSVGSSPAEGVAVAISGDGNTAIIGGPDDNSLLGAAWVFVYTFEPPPLAQQAKLVGIANSSAPSEGLSVAISGDGKTAILGGNGDSDNVNAYGAAWVFTLSGGAWTQQGSLLKVPPPDFYMQFGYCVGLSADGNTAVIGGWAALGYVYIFTRVAGVWTEQTAFRPGADPSGWPGTPWSCAISGDGKTVIVGAIGDTGSPLAYQSGSAYVFTYDGTQWSQQAKLFASDFVSPSDMPARYFGNAVALSYDGNTALIGGPADNHSVGAAWIFTRDNTGAWTQQGNKMIGNDSVGAPYQGASVALSGDGNTAIVGGTADNHNFGAAWVYIRGAGGAWTQQGAKLTAGDGGQGQSVALSQDGNTAAVGGTSDNYVTGAVWMYRRNNGVWSQQGPKLVGSGAIGNAQQGGAMAMSADGATLIESGVKDNSSFGAAWLFSSETPQATHFGVSAPILAGTGHSFTVSVTALDANNALVTGYTGPVKISTSDGSGTVPTGGQALAGGAGTFTATLNTSGTQTITVTDSSNSSITGVSGDIVVTAPAPAATTTAAGNATVAYSPSAQNTTLSATVTSTSTVNNGSVSFTVLGSTVSGSVVNGSASASFTVPAATAAGSYAIQAAYTPGSGFAASSDNSKQLTVQKATPSITWANPADIMGGTALSAIQLNATANVPGTFLYAPLAGTVLSVGASQALSVTFTPTDTADYTAATATVHINVTPPASKFSVSGYPSPTAAGATNNFTVTAQDSGGGAVTGYTGAVTFASSDSQAGLPANYTFVPGDNGSHLFSATLDTAGTQSITVKDTTHNTVTGTQSGIVVSSGSAAGAAPTAGTPQSAAIGTAFATNLQVKVTDNWGNGVSGQNVTFTAPSSGASGAFAGASNTVMVTSDSNGLATAPVFTANTLAGQYYVNAAFAVSSALSANLRLVPRGSGGGTFNLTNLPGPATNLSAQAGDSQSTAINTAFAAALVAKLTDASGNAISGQNVTFTVQANSASGSFPGAAASVAIATDSSGLATAPTLTANAIMGSFTVKASATGTNTATFHLTNVAGPPAAITVFAGDNQTPVVGTALAIALAAKVTDSGGNPVSGAAVTFTPPASGAGGSFASNATASTDATGVATASTFTANGTAGAYSVKAAVTGVATPATFSETNRAGAAASIAASGGTPQSAAVNTTFATALLATVTDSFGNPVSGVTVNFSAPTSGASATLSLASVPTNSAGAAAITAIANGTAGGPYNVTASATGISGSATFALTNLAGVPAAIAVFAGGGQTTVVGTALSVALAAKVTDSGGHPLSGVAVTFTPPLSGAGGSFASNLAVSTDASGVATASTFTANGTPGAYSVTAGVAGLASSATFTETNLVGPVASITASGGAPQSTTVSTAFATALQATVKDSFGNPVNGIAVNFSAPTSGASASLSAASAQTNASGVASVTATANGTPGAYNVTASVTGVTGSATFALTNLAGAPASIAVSAGNNQTPTVGTALATALAAKVTDSVGNPLSGVAVTFTPPASGASGSFTGSATVSTNASGIATAPTFTANGTPGAYSVKASLAGVATPATFSETNLAGVAASITATAGTPQTASLNSAFPTALQATVTDSFGNPLSGVTVNFSAPTSGASVTLSAATAQTNSSGAASVTATANGTAGAFNVTATVTGVGSATFALTNVTSNVTVQTSPAGLPCTVDGYTYANARSFTFTPGSTHTISVSSTIPNGTGAQLAFTAWSDSGAVTHTITVPSTPTTYTASFAQQYQLTTSASPASAGTVTPGTAFSNSGSTVSLHASPNPGSYFRGWTGPVSLATSPDTTVVMSGPLSVTANFQAGGSATLTPNPVVLQYYLGADPATAATPVAVNTDNPETFTVSLSSAAQGLITVSPMSGMSSGSITVSPAANLTLAAGVYTTQFDVVFGGGAHVTEQVQLQLFPFPTLRAQPASLSFAAQGGSTVASTQAQAVMAYTRNFSFTLSVTYASAQDPHWLKLDSTGGTTPLTFNVTADPTGLTPGVHQATILATSASASNSPFAIPVTFTISAPPPPPPSIVVTDIKNAASLLAGPAAPNDILSAFGTFPGCSAAQVLVDGAATTVFYSSPTQVNFLMPGKVASEPSSSVQFVCNNITSPSVTVPIASASPGIFTVTQDGKGQAALVNQDGSQSTPTPAGTYVQIYGTGFGAYSAPGDDGLMRLASPVTATVWGEAVTVLYAGQAPGWSTGLQQINLMIPADATWGVAQVVLKIGTAQTQVGVTMVCQ